MVAFMAISLCVSAADIGTFSGGTGTKEDPFKVTKIADLTELSSNLYNGVSTYEGYFFRMENDLTFTDYSGLGIGASNHAFAGTFDGNGHSLKGIQAVINRNGSDFGFFSYIAPTATLKNLVVDTPTLRVLGNALNCSFVCSHNNGIVENCHVKDANIDLSNASQNNINGGVVAYLTKTGIVRNCTFSGTVKTGCKFGSVVGANYGGMVDGCESTADIVITRANTYVGGMSATGSGYEGGAPINFKNCVFKGKIGIQKASITNTITAGICAENTNTVISGCVNKGTVMALNYNGGIAGWLFTGCTISDSRNEGVVTDIFMERDSTKNVTYNMSSYQGGIVGYSKEGIIERCFNVGKVRSYKAAAGISGAAENLTVNDCYNAGMVDGPFTWLSGNTIVEMCGGIIGDKTGPTSYTLTLNNCLSVGTINNSSAARALNSEYVGKSLSPETIKINNCHYDAQVAGWNAEGIGAMSTEVLTSGEALAGFNADVWQFTSGMYPRLKSSAATDAAIAGATPIFLGVNNYHSKVLADITLGTATKAAWTVSGGDGAVINDSKVSITRGSLPETIQLVSTVGDVARANLLNIYPNMFKGSGTATDPYIIASYDDMKTFSKVTNEGGLTFDGEYLKLSADIDMAKDATFGCMNLDMAAPFAGTFDGDGHSLINWTLANHTNSVTYGGLFGYVAESGVIKNLTIDKTCSIGLYLNGGTIAARLYGRVENCRVLPASLLSKAAGGTWGGIAGRVEESGAIVDCYVGSNIQLTGASNTVAGIASTNYGRIEGCQYAGSLTGTAANNLAGLVSSNSGVIDNCLVSGVITAQNNVGGVTANNLTTGEISNTLCTAVVNYTANVDVAGAVAGQNSGKMDNVVFDSQMSILNNINAEGLTGKLTREIIAGKYGERWTTDGVTYPQLAKFANEDAAKLTSFPIIFADTDTRIDMQKNVQATCYTTTGLTWKLEDADDFTLSSGKLKFDGWTSFCYDYVKQTYAGITRQFRIAAYGAILNGSGTESDPWIISSAADLTKLSTETAKGPNQGDYAGKHFKVTADISMTSSISGISCGNAKKFNGVIHGEGHKIDNLNISGTAPCTGLIGYLGPDGVVENLTIASGEIKNTQMYTGGIAGISMGSIINCTNYAAVTGSTQYTGGIVGYAYYPKALGKLVNYGNVSGSNFYTGGVAGNVVGANDLSEFENHGAVKGTMYVGGIFGWAMVNSLKDMKNYGEVGPISTATCNMHGGVVGVVDVCQTISNAQNYGVVSGGSTGVGGVIGRYWPSKGTTNALKVINCLNTAEITGKASNIGGIVGMAESYTLNVENSINTGAITNLAATVAAGTPAAGGIVGGGIPTIVGCFNSGVITGNNCIGGILGRVPNNTAVATLTKCTNTGWLEGYGEKSANIGSITGYYNAGSTYTDCYYDNQMSNVQAAAKADYEGASGLPTLKLTTNGLYNVPTFAAEDINVKLASVPVFFAGEDTRYNVTKPFTVGTIENLIWTGESPLVVNGTSISFTGGAVEGDYKLTATLDKVSRVIPMHINYAGTTGVSDIDASNNGVVLIDGGIVLPAGEYAVYSIAGVAVANGTSVEGQKIDLAPGIYIVVANGTPVKVNVR